MREMLNYVLEVNLGLLLLLAFYKVFLAKENQFGIQRVFLLTAILISLVLPLVHLNPSNEIGIPSISKVVPEYWLPEVTVGVTDDVKTESSAALNFWQVAGWIYFIGVGACGIWLIMQLGYVFILTKNHRSYSLDRVKVVESEEDKPSFSFFNLVYIGKANALTEKEKAQIIRHESEHARQLHSVDILFVTILGVAFWFNPFIRWYKELFIQIHEFEADARAVEDLDVNTYCNLLARVALQSHFPIASHFNESLTVKRIEMMRTVKTKIKRWKLAASLLIMISCGIFIACQDQIVEEIEKSTISQSGDYPAEVKVHMEKYLQEHPDAKLTYMDGEPHEIDKFLTTPEIKSRVVYEYTLNRDGIKKKGVLLTNVIDYANQLQNEEKVFMVVEQQPEFPGGMEALRDFIKQNVRYPQSARTQGIEGTVYVTMIIDQTGSILTPRVLRGISADCDAEAVRVISMLPKWSPGMQNGKAVKVRYNVPIKFALGNVETGSLTPVNEKMSHAEITVTKTASGTVITGRMLGSDGRGLPGVNIIIAGTTIGTVTDLKGNYKLVSPSESGKVVASFIGMETAIKEF